MKKTMIITIKINKKANIKIITLTEVIVEATVVCPLNFFDGSREVASNTLIEAAEAETAMNSPSPRALKHPPLFPPFPS